MKKILLFIIFIVFLFCLPFYLTDILSAPEVCFKDNCFSVELAKTAEDRSQGLMLRQSLDKNKGMLFIFEQEGIYPFWMKNTLIPLDIIWIDNSPAGEKKIVFINKNSQPCSPRLAGEAGGAADCQIINPEINAEYVLEINAGISEEIGLKAGDDVIFTGFAP